MSFSSALNPNVVKTALDDVFMQVFDEGLMPNQANAMTSAILKQDTASSSAVIMELFGGSGEWEARSEEQDVPQGAPLIKNQKTFSVVNYAKSIDITKNFFDDNMHGAYTKMVEDFALKARVTRDKNAMAIFRNAFTTATTSDGVALVSDSHVTISGDTVDNKLTAVLSESSLYDAIKALMEQKSQDGTVIGQLATCLLVPPALYKSAVQITEAELRSNTGGAGAAGINEPNVYSSKYGLMVYTSPYLGSVVGGSETAWFVLGKNHSLTRWVRQGVTTDLVDYKFQRNNNYIYKGEFREVVGAMNFEGIVGSDGTV